MGEMKKLTEEEIVMIRELIFWDIERIEDNLRLPSLSSLTKEDIKFYKKEKRQLNRILDKLLL